MSGIRTNFLYNAFLTMSNYIVNLLVFPYVARVLGVEIMGKIGFANNLAAYITLFAVMGVTTVGIREIASCGSDRQKRSKVFSSLMAMTTLLTVSMTLLYVAATLFVPRLACDKALFLTGAIMVFSTSYLIEWLFQGLENFRYITIRNLAVRALYAVLVFALIRRPEDYHLYFALTAGTVVVNSLINIYASSKYVSFSLRDIDLGSYLKPVMSLGLYNLMVSMYTTFNVVYLGFVSSEIEVGYYYTSTKVYAIIIGLFTALTNVMIPRMSALLTEGNKEEFDAKIGKIFDLVFSISMPLAMFFAVMAPQTIRVLSGAGYEGAILPMQIIMPVLIITSMAQIWVLQVLIPYRKDSILLKGAVLGAVVGVAANIILAKPLGAVGAALVMLLSELAGNAYTFAYVLKHRLISFPVRTLMRYFGVSLPVILLCMASARCSSHAVPALLIAAAACGIYFLLVNVLLLRQSTVSEQLRSILSARHKS